MSNFLWALGGCVFSGALILFVLLPGAIRAMIQDNAGKTLKQTGSDGKLYLITISEGK